jgi:sugar phosphate isomerase/epimerase
MKKILITDNDEFDVVLPFCYSEGLGIELQSFWNPTLTDPIEGQIEHQSKNLNGIGLIAFHGPFGDLNCGSYDPLIRDVSRERMLWGYQIANRLGAHHIIFHHGYVPHTSPPENWVPRFVQFWKSFLADMPDYVNFYLENILELSPEIMIETIDKISDPRVNACLDIGHANCNSNSEVLNWIKQLGNRIKYTHLHDNNGSEDQHLAIGKGIIPYIDVCNALNEYSPDAIWSLEVETDGIRDSYQWLIENGFAANTKIG